jgi:hypothetical protein
MRRLALSLAVIALCSAQVCDPPPQRAAGHDYASVTLKHSGFDFSGGVVPPTWETSDGHTTNWPPTPSINPEKAYGAYVWFEPFANTNTQCFMKDMGTVTLESVTAVPTEWDGGPGVLMEPLAVDHVYVIKCLDGYAKFLVKAIYPQQEQEWAVDVEYAYTAGSTFDN